MSQRNVFKENILITSGLSFNIQQKQNHEAVMILTRHFSLLRQEGYEKKYSQSISTFIFSIKQEVKSKLFLLLNIIS